MKQVAIIGGGIIGATAAWTLAKAGAKVTVYDPGEHAASVSAGSLAWLNACSTADESYATLRLASMRLWHRIKDDHADCPAVFNGALMWGDDPKAVDAQVEQMNAIGWPCEALDAVAVTRVAPSLIAPARALFAKGEGFADPKRITDWIRAKSKTAGAVWEKARVSISDVSHFDAVVVAAGNTTPALMAPLGIEVPMRSSPGIVMRTAPLSPVTPFVLATPDLDLWQDEAGVICMSSSLSKTPNRADEMLAADAVEVLKKLFPGIGEVEIESIIRRDRPIPKDGFPIIGPSGADNVWIASMHSGMTLAPIVAQVLTDDILGKPTRFDVSCYGLNRASNMDHERAAL